MALNILLLDDDPVTGVLVGRMLAQLGYPEPTRGIGQGAVADWRRFDLVLVDFETLDAGQLEASGTLLQDRNRSRPRVISMSAGDDAGTRHLVACVDERLAKPLALQPFAEAMSRVCPRDEGVGSRHFNPAKWRSLLALFGRDGLTELVDTLVKDLPEQRERLQQARHDDDLAGLRRLAHALRGACQQLGAETLAAAASLTEDAALAGASAPAFAHGSRLVDDYAALIGRLESELAGL